MQPIPCSHCGGNFMRPTNDPEAPKLCNNCLIREQTRSSGQIEPSERMGILLYCTKEIHKEIEELCINHGVDFSQYFLNLHQRNMQEHDLSTYQKESDTEQQEIENTDSYTPKKRGSKK